MGKDVATIGSTYGEVKAGFFPINFSAISSVKFSALIVPSIVIAFLCAIESLLSATVASGITGAPYNANQELVGQGVANICSSLLGGLPATGAIARTAAGIENGARSPLAGMFHAVFVLIMYFALMGIMQYIPLAVFSAILISVAINMSRFPLFIKLLRFGIRDVIVLVVTCVLTVAFDLTYGVIGGVVVTFIVNLKNLFKGVKIVEVENAKVPTISVEGAVYFLNANKLVDVASKVLENSDKLVIDLEKTDSIDQTAMEKLVSLNKKIKAQGKDIDLTNYSKKIEKRFDKYFKVF
jgi:SulP family sulfate permease